MQNFWQLKPLLCLSSCIVISAHSVAAGLGQQPVAEEMLVVGQQYDSLSAVGSRQARDLLEKIPGSIGFVESDDFLDNFTQSIGDTLVFIPGVYADTSAQRENRISIRGSGLNATFERRGLTVLRDGVPISRASGITEFQEIDPLSIQHIEVFKGANGLRYGAASLGGAINIVTPTGATQDEGTIARVEGGAFGTIRSSINTAGKSENIDYYGALTSLNSDGFRDHSAVDSRYGFGNMGISLTDTLETRFYFTALQDDFELSGSLSREDALTKPELAGRNNESADQDRNLTVYRLSNRTVAMLNDIKLEISAWGTARELDHAITPFVGIIDQHETEMGLSLHLNGSVDSYLMPFSWVLGLSHAESNNEAKVFRNVAGSNGELKSEDDQDASNSVVYAQADVSLNDSLNLIVGIQQINSERENKHIFALPAFPNALVEDDSGSLDYDDTNVRVGLIWSASEHIQHFININQGYEAPGISDITSGGAQPFTALNAQESLTYEVGTRGQYGIVAWDVAVYHSQISDEFIDVAAPGFGAGTVTNTDNAVGDTLHQGLELGVDLYLLKNTTNNAGSLTWRNILTYNDFQFDNDPIYHDNTLAGVPEVIYVSELRFNHNDGWYTGINFRHIANGAYIDYENTAQAPGYKLLGVTAGWQVIPSLRLFISAENILDEQYISNVSTVANFETERRKSVFTPGEGRSAYIGISYSF